MSSSQIPRNGRLWVVTIASLFFSLNALAAAKEVSLQVDGVATLTFGQKACNADNLVKIILPGDITKDYSDFRALPQWTAKTETKIKKCPPSIQDNQSGVIAFTKDAPSIEQSKLLRASACKAEKGDSGTGILCIYPEASGAADLVAESPKYTYDTKVAKIDDKDITEKSAVNGVIEFLVNPSSTTSIKSVEVCWGKKALGTMPADKCPRPWGTLTFKSGQITLVGLDNGVEYTIKAQITDHNDNTSPWSKSFDLTPIAASMPLDSYDGAGGNLMYSCQSAQGSWLFLGLLFLVLFLLRRRHQYLIQGPMLLLLVFMLNVPNEAKAYVGQLSVGILGSMYRPDLDNEKKPDGQEIFPFYRCQFRKKPDAPHGPITPFMGAEMDVNLFDKFGTLQVGLGLGYTFVKGKGLARDSNGAPDCNKPLEEAPASLHMWQIRPQLTYLFNPFADVFPLFPYFRGAFITHGYSFRSGKHASATVDHDGVQIKPNGFRFGWQAAAGLMLRLDFLEPGAVRSARGAEFFDHVALKAELSYTKITSFGRPGFNFSPKDVMGSRLPLLWTFGLVFDLP